MVLTGEARAFTLKRDYDDFGFLSRLTYPSGRVISYEADVLNRIVRSRNHVNGAYYPGNKNLAEHRLLVENQYRGLRLSRKSYGNGASSAVTYDGAGRVIEILHTDSQQNNLLTLQHLYDAAGNMRFKYEYTPGNDYGEVYKYDSRYQLTHNEGIAPPAQLTLGVMAPAQAEPPDNPQLAGQGKINAYLGSLAQVPNDFTFKYDKLGNRLEERHPNQQPVHYTANNLNQYTQREGTQYHYYPGGSLRQEHDGIARDYVYNHRNQIVRVTEGADLAQFRYDALGRRIWEGVGSSETYFFYDDENVIEEWQPANPQQPFFAQYVYEDDIDSRCQLAAGDAEYWYHKDLVGSTRLLSFANGLNAAYYRYTPFGIWNLNVQIPALPNEFLYAGKRYDSVLGEYCFRARHYFPLLGSFLQRDPRDYTEQPNLYTYVTSNPMTNVDPLGDQGERATLTFGEQLMANARANEKGFERQWQRGGVFGRIDAALGWIASQGFGAVGGAVYLVERPAVPVAQGLGYLDEQIDQIVGRRNRGEFELAAMQVGPNTGLPQLGAVGVILTGLSKLTKVFRRFRGARKVEQSVRRSINHIPVSNAASGELTANPARRIRGIDRRVQPTNDAPSWPSRTVRVAPSLDPAPRVSPGAATRRTVQAQTQRDAAGNFVTPTGKTVPPRESAYHYGHKPGHEAWRYQREARSGRLDPREYRRIQKDDPSIYQIEDPLDNISHRYEQPYRR